MRLLQIPVGPDLVVDLHPNISVVRGLDAATAELVRATVAGLPAGQVPVEGGLVESHGVLLDLSPEVLGLLDMARPDVVPVVERGDLGDLDGDAPDPVGDLAAGRAASAADGPAARRPGSAGDDPAAGRPGSTAGDPAAGRAASGAGDPVAGLGRSAGDPVAGLGRSAGDAAAGHAGSVGGPGGAGAESGAGGGVARIPPGDQVEWHLLSRMASQRALSFAGSVPLLLDHALDGLDPALVRQVLDRLEPMADAVQLVVLSEDPTVLAWARAAGSRRAAVVAPGPPEPV
ncbi:MAG: hypothetical protein AB7L84_08210 [Acidimicrobiia bacterium]